MTANDGQRRPTKAHKDEKGPKRRIWRRLGPRCVLFYFISSILLTTKAHSSQQWPPKANAGPQKPTAANAGPQKPTAANDGQRRPTADNAGPRRPTAANDGQRRPTQAHEDKKGPNGASGVVWALGVFLSIFFFH